MKKKIQNCYKEKKIEICFTIIFCIGIFLRFYRLEAHSLWTDEFASLSFVTKNSLWTILTKNIDIPHPPLYYAILSIITKLFGDSVWVLRMPSAIINCLSILAIFLLGKKLYSKKEGLIASSILTFSFFVIHYAQEARSYSLLLLFSILSFYFLMDILYLFQKNNQNKNKRKTYFSILGYIFSALTISYTSYLGFFFIFLQGLYLGCYFLRQLKILFKIFLIYLLFLVGYSPWLKYFFIAMQNTPGWIAVPSLYTIILDYFLYHGVWLKYFFIAMQNTPDWIAVPSLYTIILDYFLYHGRIILHTILYITILIGIFHYKKLPKLWYYGVKSKKSISFATKSLLLWTTIPYGIMYIKSVLGSSVLITRATIFIVPAIFLLEARMISKIEFTKKQAITIIAAISIFLIPIAHTYYYIYPKEDFKKTAIYALEQSKNFEAPILVLFSSKFGFNYYLQKLGTKEKAISFNKKNLNKIKQTNKYMIFVYGHVSINNKILRNFEKNMQNYHLEVVDKKHFYKAGFYLYKNLSNPFTVKK